VAVVELFSKRKRRQAQSDQSDAYSYELPQRLKIQISHILIASLGQTGEPSNWGIVEEIQAKINNTWECIDNILCREFGCVTLGQDLQLDIRVLNYFINSDSNEEALDIIELCFSFLGNDIANLQCYDSSDLSSAGITQSASNAIEELNYRFQENGCGYEFIDGKVIEKSNEFVHQEIVKEAIHLLHVSEFSGASDEFMSAHAHLKESKYKEAVQDALKSFESTLRTICSRCKWSVSSRATAKDLIGTTIDNGLIPNFLDAHFHALRATLENGLPTTRNRTSGHGQGEKPVVVPKHLAEYAIHLAAANIVLLVKAYKTM